MAAHESLRLYINRDSLMVEPSYLNPAVLSENLLIHRQSGIMRRNVPALPTSSQETVMSIYGIFGFVRLYSGEYMLVITGRERVGKVPGTNADVWRMTQCEWISFSSAADAVLSDKQATLERQLVKGAKAVLAADQFYFSYDADLTRSIQSAASAGPVTAAAGSLWRRADPRFHWNRFLQKKMIDMSAADMEQDLGGFILPVVSGFFAQHNAQVAGQQQFTFTLVARRSPVRLGTRYFCRGIDSAGNVANFVETEQVLSLSGGRVWSHVQLRGSIPLFWRQIVNVKYQPPIDTVRLVNQRDVMGRHFDALKQHYGSVLCFNLVNSHGYEMLVGGPLNTAMSDFTAADKAVKYAHFDFHKECRKMQWHRIQILLNEYDNELNDQGYTVVTESGIMTRSQTSVVRTNCMDCLDRTNVVQSEVARKMLTQQLREAGIFSPKEMIADVDSVNSLFRNVWADHADALSFQYSGTGALKTDFTRTGKRTKQGALQDLGNSIVRYVKNNFFDGSRQDAYDLLTGKYEVSASRGLPWIAPRTPRFYGLFSMMAFSLLMMLVTLLQSTSNFAYALRYLVFWFVVLVGSMRTVMLLGKEFVSMPVLVAPYPDVLPVGVLHFAPPMNTPHTASNTRSTGGAKMFNNGAIPAAVPRQTAQL